LRRRQIEVARDLLEFGAVRISQLGLPLEFGGDSPHPAAEHADTR